MGGGASSNKKQTLKNPVEHNWDVIQNGENFNVVRNKTDGREGQEYAYTLSNRYNPKNESYIFERRSKSTEPIIRVWEHQYESKGKGFIPNNFFRVITERITHRLSQTPQLSFDQSLYVLDRALEGYHFLYKSTGPFDINSNMIGFTPEGEVRVWFNQNFGENYPSHEKKTLQSTRIDETHKFDTRHVSIEEIEIVRNIVNVVEDKCQEGRFPEGFSSRIRQLVGFNEARQLVAEQLNNSDRVRLNRVDLFRNVIKSKIAGRATNQLGNTTQTQVRRVQVHHPSTSTNSTVPANSKFNFSYQQPITSN